jgi:ATP-binding cassette subfamily B multidrug efflux pump
MKGQSKGYRALLRYLWLYRAYLGIGLLALLLSDSLQMTLPLITKQVVDHLSTSKISHAYLIHQALIVLVLSFVCYWARYSWRYFMFTSARYSELDIRQRLFDRAVRLSAGYHGSTRTGELMALSTNDVTAVRMALAFGLMSSFDTVAYTAMGIGAMFHLDWKLTLWTLLPFPLLGLLIRWVLERTYVAFSDVQKSFENLTEKVRESIAGMRILRAYVQAPGDEREFERQTHQLYACNLKHVRYDGLYSPVILFLSGMSSSILLAVGGQQVIRGETTLGTFSAFSQYLAQLVWPMIAAGWTMSLVQRGAASMNRIQDLLDQEPEPVQPRLETPALGKLEVRNLTFTYPQGEGPAVQNVSFALQPGASLGIVGQIGSGKSTLAQLALRLFDPPPGTVLVDGRDVLDYNLTELRERISWVSQEAFLFSESIEDNLRLSQPDAPFSELEAVARLASLHKEVLEFPQGYQTMLGERGVTLSGGQKQRLCLARALLKKAAIFVLDDTLSAVDAETEEAILAGLKGHLRGSTALVISHRISSVRDLAHILVLDHGRVVQRGEHADLIGHAGFYQDLYRLQKEEEALGVPCRGGGVD